MCRSESETGKKREGSYEQRARERSHIWCSAWAASTRRVVDLFKTQRDFAATRQEQKRWAVGAAVVVGLLVGVALFSCSVRDLDVNFNKGNIKKVSFTLSLSPVPRLLRNCSRKILR